jgi:hypothetical protein
MSEYRPFLAALSEDQENALIAIAQNKAASERIVAFLESERERLRDGWEISGDQNITGRGGALVLRDLLGMFRRAQEQVSGHTPPARVPDESQKWLDTGN